MLILRNPLSYVLFQLMLHNWPCYVPIAVGGGGGGGTAAEVVVVV